MNAQIQEILIRRKSKVYFKSETPSPAQIAKPGLLGAIIGNFGSLGYVLSNELVGALQYASKYELETFYKETFPILQKQVGMDSSYFKPMYPNFPEQVANASDEELYINAIVHYFGDWIGERIVPGYEAETRFPFCEDTEPRFIGLAILDDITQIWLEVTESKSSPSKQDKEDINTFTTKMYLTPAIPLFNNKEKMAYTLGLLLKNQYNNWFEMWSKDNIKTATDVLRIACAYSDGDESLTKPTKFGKFSRPIRRLLLELLSNMNIDNVREDLKRHENAWIRLAEKLHPGEIKSITFGVRLAFDDLRNGRIQTTNSKIESLLKTESWVDLLTVLKTRPGDFARRLNTIISKSDNKFEVLNSFKSVADKVSTPVLWQLMGYFKSRNQQLNFRNRLFLPKTPKALVSENNLVPINEIYRIGIIQIIEEALVRTYFNLHSDIGKVYIDPICKNLLIPSGNRSTSTALRQVARGSRFQLREDASTVRLFVYWKDMDDTYYNGVDLDLSAIMYDENFKYIGHCSWTNLRHGKGNETIMVHSGDITSAPEGASEFLDINMNKLSPDVAYITCGVYCFTGQKMNQLPIAYCGWMEREFAGSGEIFEPKSVVGRCDLTADSTSTTPMILDVRTREIIWADLALSLTGSGHSTETTMEKTIATAELVSRMSVTRSPLIDLFKLHVKARNGILVDSKEDADFIIAEDGHISPYDVAKICSDFL